MRKKYPLQFWFDKYIAKFLHNIFVSMYFNTFCTIEIKQNFISDDLCATFVRCVNFDECVVLTRNVYISRFMLSYAAEILSTIC